MTTKPVLTPRITAKPFLKWAGGKGQLLEKFARLYPAQLASGDISSYHEPFLGSGAVFFNIASSYDFGSAYLYDINDELITAYRVLQKDPATLIEFLYRYQQEYQGLNDKQKAEYYYEQRNNYNLQRFNISYSRYGETWVPRAAQLIFLNKTCYNGLYRVNSKGAFNTPHGDHKNPAICDEYNLLAASKMLEKAVIRKAHFKDIRKDIGAGAFVYLDPPYRPISKTAVFKSYSKFDFTDLDQQKLARRFRDFHEKGALLMLSNSDPTNHNPDDLFFDDLYQGFNIIRIDARRLINNIAAKRGVVREIVVRNY